MDPKANIEYLSYLSDHLDKFMVHFADFMTLHIDNTGLGTTGRGLLPAVFPKDGAEKGRIQTLTDELNRLAGTLMDLSSVTNVRMIVQGSGVLDPFVNWESITMPKPLLEASNVRTCCLQAHGRLEGLKARAEALTSPTIDPVLLHPLVWAAAQRLWNDGHLQHAVAAAAEAVTGQMKQLTARNDAPDTSLWQQAFSSSQPEPDKPRLRWPGDSSDQDVKTMNDGLRLFSAGANMVIRNPATHAKDNITEQEALERLATMSVLAHLVDNCTVEAAD